MGKNENVHNSIYVSVLGKFSIQRMVDGKGGSEVVQSLENIPQRQRNFLQYLCVFHDKEVSQEELIDALWETDMDVQDPVNTLKNTLYRTRLLLEELGFSDGKKLLLYRRGFYTWAPELSITLDAEEFDRLYEQYNAAPDTHLGLQAALRALELYNGDFLPGATDALWTVSPRTYYHGQYLKLAREAAARLYKQGRLKEATELCRTATTADPYDEELQLLMLQVLHDSGLTQTAVQHYDKISKMFMEQLGVTPSTELAEFYYKLTQNDETQELNLSVIRTQLLENEPVEGAYFCEYFVFQNMYRLMARSTLRTGQAIQLAMTVLFDRDGEPLPTKRCTEAMDALHSAIYRVLRTGDIFTRYSRNQYLIMLPSSSHENAAMALERMLATYRRSLSGMTTQVQYSILPVLAPGEGGSKPVPKEE